MFDRIEEFTEAVYVDMSKLLLIFILGYTIMSYFAVFVIGSHD